MSKATADDEIIVDFDETLLLRNSTAEYLSFFKPSLLAAVVFRGLSVLRPWRWLTPKNPELSRDWFQVLVLTLLFPWNFFRWKAHATRIAHDHVNAELMQALSSTRAQVTIATYGYRFVVEPILDEMGISYSRLVACRFWGAYRDRLKGKVELLGLNSRSDKEGKLIAVTDSDADAPLLARCEFPFLIEWPGAKSRAPFAEVYLPFLYLTKVKWPGKKYLFKNILADDLPLYFLAFGVVTGQPFYTGGIIVLLVISFWCLYERGYNENDEVGELKEENPKLSEAYFERNCRVPEVTAWIWAWVLGFLGVWGLVGMRSGLFSAQTLGEIGYSMAIWSFVLFGGRVAFSTYNHSPKSIRPALYPALQLFRYVGIAALLPISLVGGLALSAQVIARSLNYLAYRKSGGADWPDVPEQIIRLGIFTLLICAFLPTTRGEIFTPLTGMFFFWFLLRASKQILHFVGTLLGSGKMKPARKVSSATEHSES